LLKIGTLVAGFATMVIAAGTIHAGSISTLRYFIDNPVGTGGTDALFGQVFVATPDDSVLTSFTFEVKNALGGPRNYTAYVFLAEVLPLVRDTTLVLSDKALFTSPLSAIPVSAPINAFNPVMISTGNLSLKSGQTYFAFIDAGRVSLDDSLKLEFGFVGDSFTPLYYPDGAAYYGSFLPYDPPASYLFGFGEDAAFDLEFAGGSTADAPEPCELGLLVAGGMLFSLLVFFRRSTDWVPNSGIR
jgi:hypothetical protein